MHRAIEVSDALLSELDYTDQIEILSVEPDQFSLLPMKEEHFALNTGLMTGTPSVIIDKRGSPSTCLTTYVLIDLEMPFGLFCVVKAAFIPKTTEVLMDFDRKICGYRK